MTHDLQTVDIVRERMGVGYADAVAALDAAEGDLVRALAIVEQQSAGSLTRLQDELACGVKRGMSGDVLSQVQWRLADNVVQQWPVAVSGIAALVLTILAVFLSRTTLELEYQQVDKPCLEIDEAHHNQPLTEVSNG